MTYYTGFTPSTLDPDVLRELTIELIRQGREPMEAIETADKAFRRLDEMTSTYWQRMKAVSDHQG